MERKHTLLRALAALLVLSSLSAAACGKPASDDPEETEAELPAMSTEITEGLTVNDSMNALLSLPAFPGYTMERVKKSVTVEGLVPDDPAAAEANTALVNRLIKDAGDNTALLFPAGTYYVAAGKDGGFYMENKKGLALKGDGTRLINTTFSPFVPDSSCYKLSNFFYSRGSQNLLITGFELDYLNHTCLDGVITKISKGYTYVTAYDEFVTGDKNPVIGGEYAYCVNTFDDEGRPGYEKYMDKSEGIRVEKDGGEPTAFRIKGEYGKRKEQISIRMASSSMYAPLVYLTDTRNATVSYVTVRSSPTVLVYAPAGSADLWVDHLTSEPAPGSRALFSTNIDCVHVSGLRGRLEMTDCRFIGLGDDALNVHSKLGAVRSVDGRTAACFDPSDDKALDEDFAAPGDTVLFFDPQTRQLGTASVLSFTDSVLTVDAVPDGVDGTSFVQNISHAPLTRVTDTVVSRGRARAFLIQTKNALISGCTVEKLRLPAVILSPDFDDWFEAGFVDNVLITGCTFREVCLVSKTYNVDGAVMISGCHDRHPFPETGINGHKNITVTGCTFEKVASNAVYARSAANVVVDGNTLTDCKKELRLDR